LTYLLDINVLVGLFDGSHVNHEAAHAWFGRRGRRSWTTCPITENGCIRVLSNPDYPSVQATPREVKARLARMCAQPGHEFWPDDISLLAARDDNVWVRLTGSQQLTDFYLAALALHHKGRLATFDGSLAKSLQGTDLAAAIELLR
jgi:toxin-antitoxin system PIN domain toxin